MITDALRDAVAEKIYEEVYPTVARELPFNAIDDQLQDVCRHLAMGTMQYEFVRRSLAETLWY